MKYEKRAQEIAKSEQEDMLLRGTDYRQETARYVSLFFDELVNTRIPFDLSREELKEVIRKKYGLDSERAHDISKNIWILLAKVRDEDRLVEHYEQATEKMKKRDADRKY